MRRPLHRLDPVIILSPGRSGSTLLQRYLNCSQDLVVWGEHGGFIRSLAAGYNVLLEDTRDLLFDEFEAARHAPFLIGSGIPVGVDIEWTNSFTREDFREAHRNLIVDLLTVDVPPAKRWGFKEIRYGATEITFLRELLPECQFVFIVRNPVEALASMIASWSSDKKLWYESQWSEGESERAKANAEIGAFGEHLSTIAESLRRGYDPARDHLIRYEDLIAEPEARVRAVCAFLEVKPPSDEAIRLVAADPRRSTEKGPIKNALTGGLASNAELRRMIEVYRAFDYV